MDINSNVDSPVAGIGENKLIPMKCPGCGATLHRSEGNKRDYFFCEYCGTKVQVNDTLYIHDDAEIIRAEYESKLAEVDVTTKKISNAFFTKRMWVFLGMTIVGIVLCCVTPSENTVPLTFACVLGSFGAGLFVAGALGLFFGLLIHLPGLEKIRSKFATEKFRANGAKNYRIILVVLLCLVIIVLTIVESIPESTPEPSTETESLPQFFTEEEIHQLEIEAEIGSRSAQYNLGCCYYIGNSVIQNYTKAFEYYSLAADQGDEDSQILVGYMYLVGLGVPTDTTKAFEIFSPLADKNNAEALLYLGNMYEYGQGVTQNLEKAADYYRRAEENGHPDAHQYLANISRPKQ